MPLYILDNTQIFFAHVPKTGGSSVQEYMARRFGTESISIFGKTKRQMERAGVGTGMIICPTHLTATDLEDFIPKIVKHKFAVVRDPVKRMISEYKFQTGHSVTTNFSFSTWLRIMFYATKKDVRACDNHIRPQVDLIPEGSEIFRLEDGFDQMIEWLDEKTGTTRDDLTVGHFLKKSAKKDFALSKQDIELIIDFYKDDYERLGYEKPDPNEFESGKFETLRCILAKMVMYPFLIKHKLHWIK